MPISPEEYSSLQQWLERGDSPENEAAIWSALDAPTRRMLLPLRDARRRQLDAQERSRRALSDRLAFFDALIDTLPTAIFAKTADTRFVLFNRAYEAMFDVRRVEMIGKTVVDLEHLPHPERLGYQAEDERLIEEARTARREVAFLCADGQIHHCLYWSSGFAYGAQNRGLIGAIVDVSEQKRIERELSQKNEELIQTALKIEEISRTDSLTELANRRFFMESLRATLSLAERHAQPFSLIMVDLDHFKAINDAQGHDVGDRVLRHFADLLRKSCRKEDLPARTGGEEFLILLPLTRLEQALSQARRIHAGLRELDILERKAPVTLSAGVVEHAPGESAEALLKRVDELLYRAKNEGRDRICA